MDKLNKDNLGMNPRFDKDNLPRQYQSIIIQPEPNYKGDGVHSVKELQELLNQYREYSHQQGLIKNALIEEVKRQDSLLNEVVNKIDELERKLI